MSDTEPKSWLENLRERRFFRFVISYLIAGWGLIQFIDWLAKRYALSPAIVDLTLVLLLALLPSVILLTYFHGRPGRDRWQRLEKIFVPVNLVLAIGLSGILFSGKLMGATADRVTITTEQGEEIERLVPKQEFLSRITIFPIELEGSTADQGWLSLGIPLFLSGDIEQDNYIHATSRALLQRNYRTRGHELGDEIPFSLQRKIAEDSYADQFITGKIRQEEGTYLLDLSLFSCTDGKLVVELNLQSTDLMDVIDQASTELLNYVVLEETRANQETQLDLPVSNLFSSNTAALEAYTMGVEAGMLGNDLDEGIRKMKEAIELDPNFVMAYRSAAILYNRKNFMADAQRYIEKALENIEVLPERMQFNIRYQYYVINQDIEKALALLEMWQTLYPGNYNPYVNQMQLLLTRAEFENAKKVGQKALDYGHRGEILLIMARISSIQGLEEEAIQYYEEFASFYPQRAAETSELGTIYMEQGRFDQARDHFDKLALLNPNDFRIAGRLAQLEASLGNMEKAEEIYQDALGMAGSARDSAEVYQWLYFYYEGTGEIRQALDQLENRWNLMATEYTTMEVGAEKLTYIYIQSYLDGNLKERYLALQEELFKILPDPTGIFKCMGDVNYAIADRDGELYMERFDNCRGLFEPILGEQGMAMMEAYKADLNGNYAEAINLMDQYFEEMNLEDQGTQAIIMGDLYIRAGKYEEAIEMMEAGVRKRPGFAKFFLMMAKCYQALGNQEEANQKLLEALELWRDADPEYRHYQDALALQEAWNI
jgi:tetratricopeptide (TPR) repeat protein